MKTKEERLEQIDEMLNYIRCDEAEKITMNKLIKAYAKEAQRETWEAAREENYDVGSGETQAEYCDFEDWYKIAIK